MNGFKYCYVILIIQFRHKVKEFQVLLSNTDNSIQHYLLVCTQLNACKYYNVTLTVICLHTVKWSKSSISNNSV